MYWNVKIYSFDWCLYQITINCTAWDLRSCGVQRRVECNPLPTFRDNVSVPSSRVKKSKTWTSRVNKCADVSVQRIGPIFKGQEVQGSRSGPTFRDNVSVPSSRVKKSMTLEDGTDTLSRNITTRRCVISHKSADLISIAAEAWNQLHSFIKQKHWCSYVCSRWHLYGADAHWNVKELKAPRATDAHHCSVPLKVQATSSFEKSVTEDPATENRTQEEWNPLQYRCENPTGEARYV
jgi:hypothetical protein